MTNIMKRVHNLISRDALLRKHLQQNIINHRALARRLHKVFESRGESASLDAIISAIRRYELPSKDIFNIAESALHHSKIASKTDLAIIRLDRSWEPGALANAISKVDYRKGEVLRLVQGRSSAKIVIDLHNLEAVQACFKPSAILNIDTGVGEVTIVLPPAANNLPGVTSTFASALALNNINIMEVMSCLPEFIWVFKEEDLLKAHKIIFDLCLGPKGGI